MLLDIDFLNTCLKNNIIPKFVQFRVSNKDLRNSTAYRQCQIELLNQENHVCNLFLIGNDKTILKHKQIQNKKLTHLRVTTLENYSHGFLIGNDKAILKHQQIQNKKLTHLRVTTLENSSHGPDKVIYNFSDYNLTESEKSVFCKGLEFAIPPSKLEHADFMLPFELLFRDIKKSDLSIPQTKAVKSKVLDTFIFFL